MPHVGGMRFARHRRPVGRFHGREVRIGIGHPGDRNEVINFVLKPPRREEREAMDEAIARALAAWPWIARGEWNAATQRINTRSGPAQV